MKTGLGFRASTFKVEGLGFRASTFKVEGLGFLARPDSGRWDENQIRV
jgi:hypothetical protein